MAEQETGKEIKQKIIDFDKKGNLVRFFLGAAGNNDYWGDDWDDRPYEHNAGEVYDEFVTGYMDVFFPYEYTVLCPEEDWSFHGNSPWCKDDMKSRVVPCIVAMGECDPDEEHGSWWYDGCFSRVLANDRTVRFYFNDPADPVAIMAKCPGAVVQVKPAGGEKK